MKVVSSRKDSPSEKKTVCPSTVSCAAKGFARVDLPLPADAEIRKKDSSFPFDCGLQPPFQKITNFSVGIESRRNVFP
jgi:hypothetical protein